MNHLNPYICIEINRDFERVDMEGLKNVKIAPEVHAKAVDHCKNRPVKVNIGDWTAQAILEKIEREKPKDTREIEP